MSLPPPPPGFRYAEESVPERPTPPQGYRFADEPPLREVNRGRPTENRALAGFTPVVTEQGRKAHPVDKIDPRLYEIMALAAKDSPYEVRFDSGYRKGDKRQHGKHNALDVELWRDDKKLSDYQDPRHFREYEQFAQSARRIQQQLYPELDGAFRWGGYFSGKKNYGALDLMHFDVGGGKGLGMLGGSWDGGLTDKQRSLWKGIQSEGMGGVRQASGPMGPPITQLRRDMQQYFPPLPEGYRFADEAPSRAASVVPTRPSSKAAWVNDMMQYATPAARRLGVDPAFLVAHAAQETGWGQGVHDNNLFNITGSYKGMTTRRGDTDGEGRKIKQGFRVYPTYEEAFQDLGDQLARNWPKAIGAKDIASYGRGLEQGRLGRYAGDKLYTDHIAERYAELQKVLPKGSATGPAPPPAPTTIASSELPPPPPGYRYAD